MDSDDFKFCAIHAVVLTMIAVALWWAISNVGHYRGLTELEKTTTAQDVASMTTEKVYALQPLNQVVIGNTQAKDAQWYTLSMHEQQANYVVFIQDGGTALEPMALPIDKTQIVPINIDSKAVLEVKTKTTDLHWNIYKGATIYRYILYLPTAPEAPETPETPEISPPPTLSMPEVTVAPPPALTTLMPGVPTASNDVVPPVPSE